MTASGLPPDEKITMTVQQVEDLIRSGAHEAAVAALEHLRHVGWINAAGSLIPVPTLAAVIPEDWRRVYVLNMDGANVI